MNRKPLRAIIAGGGTGGHLFPGIAIAQSIQRKNPESRIRFVGSGRPLEKKVLSEAGFALSVIPVEGIKGRGWWRQAKVVFRLPLALLESVFILLRHWPQVVIGMGGYSSGPVVLAARLLGRKAVLHEQNRLPGVTTRLLVPFAHAVCVSFEDTLLKVSRQALHLTGNPIRKSLLESAGAEASESRGRTVLVLGGSQGAHAINLAMMAAAEKLTGAGGLEVIHQSGEADAAMVAQAYARAGLPHEVRPFFTEMGPLYRRADLVVCRAGATTVAEIVGVGKPSIFIPFSAAADDHQRLNAEALVAKGAAEMILEKDLDGPMLADRILALLSDNDRLEEMGRRAALRGFPDAADSVADVCYRLVYGG